MQIKESTIQYNGESIIADIIGDDSQIDILMIHWWGLGSNRKRFHKLRLDLAKHGITSVAFDHLWHGESSWNLLWSTLKSRTEQVEIIANELSLNTPTMLLWTSMGAYTAIIAWARLNIKKLSLFVPGVYNPNAYELPFWPEFSQAIRQHNSWGGSDAFSKIQELKWKILIFWAERDQVIPREIPERLHQASAHSTIHWIDSDHNIQQYIAENDTVRSKIVAEIQKVINI